MKKIIIGIDGGGTRTTALMASMNTDGTYGIIAKGIGGGSNFASDTPLRAAENTLNAISSALKPLEGSREEYEVVSVAVGSSALDDFTDTPGKDEFSSLIASSSLFSGQEKRPEIILKSDAYISLYAMTEGGSGAILISGTGVMGMACNGFGELCPVSGWGDRLGDEGSGYYIASEGLKAALRFSDGIGESTSLYGAMLSHYGISSPRFILDKIYAPDYDKSILASFSKCVSEEAEKGDRIAKDILLTTSRILSGLALSLVRFSRSPIFGMYGSIFRNDKIIREEFLKQLAIHAPEVRPAFPSLTAEEAAVRLAINSVKER